MTAFPDLSLTMDELELQATHPIYRWSLTGTHAETGHSVAISGYEVWTVGDDGLIVESRGHYDSAAYEAQVNGTADS